MFRTGPQGFLFGFLVYLRSGQLVLPALATEGEHLVKCGVRPLQGKLLGLGAGIQVGLLCAKREGVTKPFVRAGRATAECSGGSREGPALPQ